MKTTKTPSAVFKIFLEGKGQVRHFQSTRRNKNCDPAPEL